MIMQSLPLTALRNKGARPTAGGSDAAEMEDGRIYYAQTIGKNGCHQKQHTIRNEPATALTRHGEFLDQ